MKIYVASSWRNPLQPAVVAALRDLGHEVYDFRNPPTRSGFSWSEVNPDWKITDGRAGYVDADTYRAMLAHPLAEAGYASDIGALRDCEVVVYVLPCGRSASWEFGYAMGAGKPGFVVWFEPHEPELMFREAPVLGSMQELRDAFAPGAIAEFAVGEARYERGMQRLLADLGAGQVAAPGARPEPFSAITVLLPAGT